MSSRFLTAHLMPAVRRKRLLHGECGREHDGKRRRHSPHGHSKLPPRRLRRGRAAKHACRPAHNRHEAADAALDDEAAPLEYSRHEAADAALDDEAAPLESSRHEAADAALDDAAAPLLCAQCARLQPHAAFSKSQQRKKHARRCVDCVSAGAAPPPPLAADEAPPPPLGARAASPRPPADPLRMGKRPRRARDAPPAPTHPPPPPPPPAAARTCATPASLPLVSRRRAALPLRGFPYGAANSCPVDTLLTFLLHALSAAERQRICPRRVGGARTAAARALRGALKLHRLGKSAEGKRRWYEMLCGRGECECACGCGCANCRGGLCTRCASCGCDEPFRMGHCFGIAEQLFLHVAPAAPPPSPLQLATLPTWVCSAGCPYSFAASSPVVHLPLLLPLDDVQHLLNGGTPYEVGALCSAHLFSNTYNYGRCPQCGEGDLRARATVTTYPHLLVVELGRRDWGMGSSAASQLPWPLAVATELELGGGPSPRKYDAIAVFYNNGAHWWADLLCSRHFRKRKGSASYRYDGLEAGGKLRYCSPSLTMTSDARYISMVVYRCRPVQDG